MSIPSLEKRKQAYQERVEAHGVPLVSDLEDEYFWLDHLHHASPIDAGRRMMILLSLAFLAQSPEANEQLEAWLLEEGLWDSLSPSEKDFVRVGFAMEDRQREISWNMEGAYMLAWALNLVPNAPDPATDINDDDMDAMNESVIEIGGETKPFFARLGFRPLHEIRDENLFYTALTAQNNELFLAGGEGLSTVHPIAAFERDRALNWLFQIHELDSWDDLNG